MKHGQLVVIVKHFGLTVTTNIKSFVVYYVSAHPHQFYNKLSFREFSDLDLVSIIVFPGEAHFSLAAGAI